ncbi:DNA-binding protein SMUBP-2 [Rhagoletis pomonella]|uniref:DNA-binding protein SMUBP-2 n=1 Tax=Rhagoletis pomonella TaxID=28610 RepID=UPI0017823D6C|nr:DNA-binding protein SMUBP-2 [Rhagoletis pomonella]
MDREDIKNKSTANNLATKKLSSPDEVQDAPLFPIAPGKSRPDYGTNNTLELLERIPTEVVNLKLDDVLSAVKDVDNLCDYPRCKTKTKLMGQDCELCRKRFCFKHGLPEVHGCGDAVKREERVKFLHPKPAKTVRAEADLAQAKKRLQSKLKDMKVERMQKVSGGPPIMGAKGGAGGSGGSDGKGARRKKGK